MLRLRMAKAGLAVVLGLFCCAAGLHGEVKKKRPVHHPVRHARHVLHNRSSVERRSNGHVSDVHNEQRHMDIHHNLSGGRHVAVERADHSRVVAERGRGGYIERPYAYRGHDFYHRTYYWHGRVYDRYYRGWMYHGLALRVYAPYRYWPVGFYGWAYHPWRTHVLFAWGWGGHPWYPYYGYYFAPYPAYASAGQWITDAMMANDLQAAYDAGRTEGRGEAAADEAAAPGAPGGVANGAEMASATGPGPALTPEIKDAIAQEVDAEIALENAEAVLVANGQEPDPGSSGLGRLLSDGKPHVFVVGGPLDVLDEATDAECALSEGDVLQITEAPPEQDDSASLKVLASKGGGKACSAAAMVTVRLDDLQEMQNHMREQIDEGLETLQQKAGSDGLPALPPAAQGPAKTAGYAPLAPPPDPNGAQVVDQAQQDAGASEQEVMEQEKAEAAKPK